MLAVTISMIPVLYTAVGDRSAYYIGRTLWFGLICLYSLGMNVVQVHWINLHEEFKCHGNITYPCFVECFEQLFSISIIEMLLLLLYLHSLVLSHGILHGSDSA